MKRRSGGHRAELDASDAVAQLVERRRPTHDAHHVGDHQQDPTGDARLGRKTHLRKRRTECLLKQQDVS